MSKLSVVRNLEAERYARLFNRCERIVSRLAHDQHRVVKAQLIAGKWLHFASRTGL